MALIIIGDRDLVMVVLRRVEVMAGSGVVHDGVETVNKTNNQINIVMTR